MMNKQAMSLVMTALKHHIAELSIRNEKFQKEHDDRVPHIRVFRRTLQL
jgi:hypothetical protein